MLFLVCKGHIPMFHCSTGNLKDKMYNILHWKMGFCQDMGHIILYQYERFDLWDNLYKSIN